MRVTPSLPRMGGRPRGACPRPRFFINLLQAITILGDTLVAGVKEENAKGPQERKHVSVKGINRIDFFKVF
jgi:hypothetical protein